MTMSNTAAVLIVVPLIFTSMLLPTPSLAQAVQVQFFGPDARSQGMAGAFTAIAEGPAVAWWNPGGLALQETVYGSPFSYVQLVPDLADDVKLYNFGGTASIGAFGVGTHFTHITYGENEARNREGVSLGTFEPTENVFLIGGGVDVAELLGIDGAYAPIQLGVGGNLKFLDSNLAPAFASPEGRSGDATSWDVDLGMLFVYQMPFDLALDGRPTTQVSLRGGAVVNNLFEREIDYLDQNVSYPLDRRFRFGAAAEFEVGGVPPFDHLMKATVSVEQTHHIEGSREAVERFGIEVSALSLLAIRTGYLHEGDAFGECCSFNDWSWGFGLGADLELQDSTRIGGRFDFASITTAVDLSRHKMYTVSGWITF
jgi:hypothetical protein